jgi:hypothetical protein
MAIIILDERDFISKEFQNHGFGVFDFMENHKVSSMKDFCHLPLSRRAQFLLVDTETVLNYPHLWESFKSTLNTFLGAIFLHEQSNKKAHFWVEEQGMMLTKIVGEYSLPMGQLQWTMMANQLNFLWTVLEEQKSLQRHMYKLSVELDQVLQTAEAEMLRAKKVHELLIPKRNEEIKGISFLNKYAAGEGGGGEFYDLHHAGNKIYQVMISSQSYLISSALIGLLSQHKEKNFNHQEFLKEALQEIQTINSSKKKKSEVDLLVLEIDTSHLGMKIYGWGKAELYSQVNGKLAWPSLQKDEGSSPFEYQLQKGEKIIVLSSGFIFNWKESDIKTDIGSFLKDHQHMDQANLVMELLFQLKNVKETKFLTKDATVVMMEVNRHGIHQI